MLLRFSQLVRKGAPRTRPSYWQLRYYGQGRLFPNRAPGGIRPAQSIGAAGGRPALGYCLYLLYRSGGRVDAHPIRASIKSNIVIDDALIAGGHQVPAEDERVYCYIAEKLVIEPS